VVANSLTTELLKSEYMLTGMYYCESGGEA